MADIGYKISIVIPVYRAVSTLEAACASVFRAASACGDDRYTFELILIDDGSDDGSGELCDRICERYGESSPFTNVRVEHTENGGVSRARNRGLELSEGDYVCFIDADDTVSEKFFTAFIEALAGFPDAVLIDMTTSLISDTPVNGDDYLENAILESDTHVWGKLFRSTEAKALCFPEGLTIGEDMLFLLELALSVKGACIVCIPRMEYLYSLNEEGAMLSPFRESYLDQITCWEMARDRIAAERGKRRLSPYIDTKLSCIRIMAAFLVLGKAALDPEKPGIQAAERTIKEALRTNGAYAGLSPGYKLKTMIFRISPALYMRMYAGWKGRTGNG